MSNIEFYDINGVKENLLHDGFSLQVHITEYCQNSCLHCYLGEFDDSKKHMDFSLIKKIVDELNDMNKIINKKGTLVLMGGDPILHPKFWDILEYILVSAENINVVIGTNPESLDYFSIMKLNKYNIRGIQISLDGLEQKHDEIRGDGSFSRSIKALTLLMQYSNSQIYISNTVGTHNFMDTIQLYYFVLKNKLAHTFGVKRILSIGNASTNNISHLDKHSYRKLLYQLLVAEIESGGAVSLSKYDPLWYLLYYELGLIFLKKSFFNSSFIKFGCNAGRKHFMIDVTGTIYPCVLVRKKIGTIVEQKLIDVLSSSFLVKKLDTIENYEKCKTCLLKYHCRGCLGMRLENNKIEEDPQCWRGNGRLEC